MLQVKPKLEAGSIRLDTDPGKKQRRRMGLAVVLLLAALLVIAIKDHDAWFGSAEGDVVADSEMPQATTPPSAGSTVAAPPAVPNKTRTRRAQPEPVPQPVEQPAIVTSNRRALPPLDIEVVAGNNRRTVHPSNNAVHVDTAPESAETAPPQANVAINAAQHVTMSQDTAHAVDRSVEPSYPTLARQMKVQGAVVLQALIGSDGLIQDLRVVSGPGILATAAQEAVRQWRFKPYVENGKAVETQARITVNFTISTF